MTTTTDIIATEATPVQFTLFAKLPCELREMIWRMCVRNIDLRGVHFFRRHSNPEDDGIIVHYRGIRCRKPPVLAAPISGPLCSAAGCTSKGDILDPWRHHNDSTYLIDSGLWTACRESRAVILKAFRAKGYPRKIDYDSAYYYKDDAVGTAYFFSGGGQSLEMCYFTVFPHRDLFVLQGWEDDAFVMDELSWNAPFAQCGNRKEYLVGLVDVAVEFNENTFGKDTATSLAAIIYEQRDQHEFYIIDYNAHPRRFGEHLEMRLTWCGDKYGYTAGFPSPACDDFISELELAISDLDYVEHGYDRSRFWDYHVVVLACVKLDRHALTYSATNRRYIAAV